MGSRLVDEGARPVRLFERGTRGLAGRVKRDLIPAIDKFGVTISALDKYKGGIAQTADLWSGAFSATSNGGTYSQIYFGNGEITPRGPGHGAVGGAQPGRPALEARADGRRGARADLRAEHRGLLAALCAARAAARSRCSAASTSRGRAASVDHRVPRIGVAISVLLAIGAAITFIFLNQRFEGPDPAGFIGSPYELTARFDDSKTLPSKQAVLHKGVSVGRVNSVDYDSESQEAVVTFTLTGEIGPIYRDAVLQIGERSLLGDAYLNLLDLGTPEAGELQAGDEVAETLDSVDFDEALDFLDTAGRRRVRSLIDTVAEGVAREGNGARLSGTVGGAARTIHELRRLTDALRGQEEQIAGLVSDSAVVLDELGSRETAIRQIVGSGRITLDALASNTVSLQQGIEELPRLLVAGRSTLASARPLLSEARPVVTQLGELAPKLAPAFGDGRTSSGGLAAISSGLVSVVKGLPEQRRVSEKVLPKLTKLNQLALPLVQKAGPAALNTVPIADYLAPRTNSIGAFYANGASAVAHSDEVGRYARFAIIGDPGLLSDSPHDGNCVPGSGEPASPGPGFCYNAYPQPDDALNNQPFAGSYPQLLPYAPPPR